MAVLARPGAMEEMQKDCRPLLRVPAPAALVHLASKDGGNAEGLLGTIPAMHVRTILAMWSCGRGRGGTSSGSSVRAARQAGLPRRVNPGLRAERRREASCRVYRVALEK